MDGVSTSNLAGLFEHQCYLGCTVHFWAAKLSVCRFHFVGNLSVLILCGATFGSYLQLLSLTGLAVLILRLWALLLDFWCFLVRAAA
jgi:hypothetical protein